MVNVNHSVSEEGSNMSILSSRKAVIPVWLATVVTLSVLFGSPLTFANGLLVLLVGIGPPVIALILSRAPSPSVAQVMRDASGPRMR